MNSRKNPKLDVYRHSGLFFQIGLLITMALVVGAFQWEAKAPEDDIVTPEKFANDLEAYIPVTIIDEKKPPKPKNIVVPKSMNVISAEAAEPSNEPIESPVIEVNPEIFIESLPEPTTEVAPEVEDYAEVMPSPEEGYEEFYRYLGSKIRYPRQAREISIEGKVYVRFIINRDGSMTDVEVIKGIGAGCDEEVLRVFALKDFPKWHHGRSGGRPVRVRMAIPVFFKLK